MISLKPILSETSLIFGKTIQIIIWNKISKDKIQHQMMYVLEPKTFWLKWKILINLLCLME